MNKLFTKHSHLENVALGLDCLAFGPYTWVKTSGTFWTFLTTSLENNIRIYNFAIIFLAVSCWQSVPAKLVWTKQTYFPCQQMGTVWSGEKMEQIYCKCICACIPLYSDLYSCVSVGVLLYSCVSVCFGVLSKSFSCRFQESNLRKTD